MNIGSLFKGQRKLALFIPMSILLVLWLSISFWVQAYVEREDAKKIQRFSVHENHLFELSTHLSEQRSLVHRLLSGNSVSQESIVAFNDSLTTTDSKIQLIHDSFLEEMELSSDPDQETGSEDVVTLDSRLSKIDLHQKSLKDLSSPVENQMQLSKLERDSDFKMAVFRNHTNFIDAVNDIRQSVHFVPRFTNQDVLYYSELSNAAWYLNESTRQADSLLEGMTLDGSEMSAYSAAIHANMITASLIQSDMAVQDLRRQRQKLDLNSPLEVQVDKVVEMYHQNYKSLSQQHQVSLLKNTAESSSLEQWRNETVQLKQQAELLGAQAATSLISNVKTAENTALRNIIIDTFIVLLCVLMAAVSLIYFRKVHRQAHHDELTGLPNRRMFLQTFHHMMDDARTNQQPIWLLTIDLDRFKVINDSMGHGVGDKLLVQVAERLQDIAECSPVARMGGDEFTVLSTKPEAKDVDALATKLQRCLTEPFHIDGGVVHIGGSVGVCGYPTDVDSAEDLLKASDLAMYSAKNAGRNMVIHFERSMVTEYELRLRTERELQFAVDGDQFELHFQPKFSRMLGEVDSVEALIRWNHPERGQVPPFDFIPIAEECGMLPQIGNWVLDEACKHAAQWANEDGLPLRVAVNVSTEQFLENQFVDNVFSILSKHKLDAKYLELEVTESVVMADIDKVVAALKQLRSAGIKIALDDFGTGYSSLSYLQNLPLDTLKVDKSFVQKLEEGGIEMEAITQTITQLATTLGLETVAEGVETADQLSHISKLGVDVIQGYLYSKPVPALDVIQVIRDINSAEGDDSAAA